MVFRENAGNGAPKAKKSERKWQTPYFTGEEKTKADTESRSI
jgi:hypothetical protein